MRNTERIGWLTALTLSLVSHVSLAQGENTGKIYTCTDAKGRKLTSDRPIRECLDREQKVLNPSGTVREKIGPVLTAQERAEQEARAKLEQEERARQDEEKRRDRALLIRYPNAQVHQKERTEALEHIARVKQSAATRVAQLQADRAKLDEESAFYKKDPSKMPAKLKRQLKEVDDALAAQARFITEQDAETERVIGRFDAEAVRLDALWRSARGLP